MQFQKYNGYVSCSIIHGNGIMYSSIIWACLYMSWISNPFKTYLIIQNSKCFVKKTYSKSVKMENLYDFVKRNSTTIPAKTEICPNWIFSSPYDSALTDFSVPSSSVILEHWWVSFMIFIFHLEHITSIQSIYLD